MHIMQIKFTKYIWIKIIAMLFIYIIKFSLLKNIWYEIFSVSSEHITILLNEQIRKKIIVKRSKENIPKRSKKKY